MPARRTSALSALSAVAVAVATAAAAASPPFEPTAESLRTHQLPAWFDDAKLGMMVHWTPAAVPAFAPLAEDPSTVVSRDGFAAFFGANPYAEWYANSLRIPGSAVAAHHNATYGPDRDYHLFGAELESAATADGAFDADTWAQLAQDGGARYVVMVAKHHDGYTLWPTAHPPPARRDFGATRDFVGEVTDAVRARGLRMGLYYSGGLDWTFDPAPITDVASLLAATPHTTAYGAHADAHMRELIARYRPSVLWGDMGYPSTGAWRAILAEYYNAIPDGVVNNRFGQNTIPPAFLTPGSIAAATVNRVADWLAKWYGGLFTPPGGPHDFSTPEYSVLPTPSRRKWESVRGLTASFGYNRNDRDDTHIAVDALVHLLVDIVAKNGNLLLNVGSMANGTIPAAQAARFRALGAWLGYAGPAIYGTRPWTRSDGVDANTNTLPIRYTLQPADGGAVYATVLGQPARSAAAKDSAAAAVVVVGFPQLATVPPGFSVTLLTPAGPVACAWTHDAGSGTVWATVPEAVPAMPAWAFKLAPAPRPTTLSFTEFVDEARTPMLFAFVATMLTTFFVWTRVPAGPPAPVGPRRPGGAR